MQQQSLNAQVASLTDELQMVVANYTQLQQQYVQLESDLQVLQDNAETLTMDKKKIKADLDKWRKGNRHLVDQVKAKEQDYAALQQQCQSTTQGLQQRVRQLIVAVETGAALSDAPLPEPEPEPAEAAEEDEAAAAAEPDTDDAAADEGVEDASE